MKTAEELGRNWMESDGEICEYILAEHDKEIISLIDEMIDKLEQSRSSGRLTQIALAGVNLTIIRLQELKQKILKESEQ